MKLFKKCAIGIFILFMGTMIYVTAAAYLRRSGSTGLDMGRVQQLRYETIPTSS